MKRLLLSAVLGITCAQQAHANDTLKHALQTVGTQFISAKNTFDNSSFFAQATIPVAVGLAASTVYTIGKAGAAHNLYETASNLYSEQCNNKFINTLVYGGQAGGSETFAEIHNIGHTWNVGIIGGTILGILYGLYKHGIKDGLKIAVGASISGYGVSFIANKVCKPYYLSQLRTTFFE
jgi:hypothetical protein